MEIVLAIAAFLWLYHLQQENIRLKRKVEELESVADQLLPPEIR